VESSGGAPPGTSVAEEGGMGGSNLEGGGGVEGTGGGGRGKGRGEKTKGDRLFESLQVCSALTYASLSHTQHKSCHTHECVTPQESYHTYRKIK